jgi:hypothetical protein
MPSPATAFVHELRPFPTEMTSSSDGEGRPAYTLFESFAREETVILVETVVDWNVSDDGDPPDAVFDVVAAYAQDAQRVNPSTSMFSVPVHNHGSRRFLVGVPGGHKLVVYPADASRAPALQPGSDRGYLRTTIVDYWA